MLQKVSHLETGESNIEKEYVSPRNRQFVLHDSNGFEPGDLVKYEIVCKFILGRLSQGIPPEDRVHGIWCEYFSCIFTGTSLTTIRLCTETPPARGRVFKKGNELLVDFAYKHQGTFRPFVFLLHFDRLVIMCSLNMTD